MLDSELRPQHVRLRIAIDEEHFHDFAVDWAHDGPELMVFRADGIVRTKPANAAKEIFGKSLPKIPNVARALGRFVNVSQGQATKIADYSKVAIAVWKGKGKLDVSVPTKKSQQDEAYFDNITAHKQKKIHENIICRSKLWKEYLITKQMTAADFQEFSEFKRRAVAGFLCFITQNNIASKKGGTYYLNEAVIPG